MIPQRLRERIVLCGTISCILLSGCIPRHLEEAPPKEEPRAELIIGAFVCKTCGAEKSLMVKGTDVLDTIVDILPGSVLKDLTGKEVDPDEAARRMALLLKIVSDEAEGPAGVEIWHRFDLIPEKFRDCPHVWEFGEEYNVNLTFKGIPLERFISHPEETTKKEPELGKEHKDNLPQGGN